MSTPKSPDPSRATPEAAAFAQWRTAVEAELKGVPFEKKLITRTFEGLALQPLYGRQHAPAASTPAPGEAPFVRGVLKNGYTDRAWQVCQETDAGTPAGYNASVRRSLARGETVLSLRLDRAGRIGLDPDASAAGDDTGGLVLADVVDLRAAFDKIALTNVTVHLEAGATPLPAAALYLTQAREKRASWKKIKGGITADPLAEWAVRGELSVSLEAIYEDMAAWTAWAHENAPGLATIGVSAQHWHEAGGHAVQELAFALASGVEYLRAMATRGVAPTLASSRMRFRFASGAQFFAELAKFRAFRPLWSRVLQGFGVAPEKAWPSVHAATARWNQTRLDPHVNMLRTTTGALSAVLGGVDSLHVSPFNEVLGGSDEFSQRIAANIQTMLAEEFRLLSPTDPAGGSWYLEALTDELARKAWALFQTIEREGGIARALQNGTPQKLIATAATEKRDAINKRRLGLIGTNLFPNLKERTTDARASDAPNVRTVRAAEIAPRRPRPKKAALPARWPARLKEAMGAARAGATLGQLMTRAYGAAPAGTGRITPVMPWRAAEGFESLRQASDAFAAAKGRRPQVFLARMGPAIQHKARADFSAGFFAAGGFEAVGKQSFDTAEAAAQAAISSGAPVAVLCSTDETYPELAPVFARAIKAAAPHLTVVLAGYPTEHIEAFRAAGFDEFIHLRADVHGMLAQLLTKIGALNSASSSQK